MRFTMIPPLLVLLLVPACGGGGGGGSESAPGVPAAASAMGAKLKPGMTRSLLLVANLLD